MTDMLTTEDYASMSREDLVAQNVALRTRLDRRSYAIDAAYRQGQGQLDSALWREKQQAAQLRELEEQHNELQRLLGYWETYIEAREALHKKTLKHARNLRAQVAALKAALAEATQSKPAGDPDTRDAL